MYHFAKSVRKSLCNNKKFFDGSVRWVNDASRRICNLTYSHNLSDGASSLWLYTQNDL